MFMFGGLRSGQYLNDMWTLDAAGQPTTLTTHTAPHGHTAPTTRRAQLSTPRSQAHCGSSSSISVLCVCQSIRSASLSPGGVRVPPPPQAALP